RRAVSGLDGQDMAAVPIEGQWSIQQVVLHLMDSDLIAADRMKRIIAEENPVIIGFDETKFAQNLAYDQQPVGEAVEIFDRNRKLFARVLKRLPASAWTRFGTHNERGKITLGDMLKTYVGHLDHHLKFIYQKREKLGELLW
ncbi:MAG TPA: DinB family protein, partial [Tepidisphaeraceae bacterium]